LTSYEPIVMGAKVIDVSVIAAAIFAEPNAEEALALLDGVEICAPRLLGFELANVARTKTLRNPQKRDDIRRALELGLQLEIRWFDVPYLDVLEVALETGLTVYDASYRYLARHLAVPLLSFDRRLTDSP
jgi:predicted nucleic acid-binding protein